jgi:hypothetical protein
MRLIFVINVIDPSGIFLRDLPFVRIPPGWVSSPEQVKSSSKIAAFSLWTGMFWDGISSIPDETHRCDLVVIVSFVETGYTTSE